MWLYTDFKIYMNNCVRIRLFKITLKKERLKFLTLVLRLRSTLSLFHSFVALTANVQPPPLLLLYTAEYPKKQSEEGVRSQKLHLNLLGVIKRGFIPRN